MDSVVCGCSNNERAWVGWVRILEYQVFEHILLLMEMQNIERDVITHLGSNIIAINNGQLFRCEFIERRNFLC